MRAGEGSQRGSSVGARGSWWETAAAGTMVEASRMRLDPVCSHSPEEGAPEVMGARRRGLVSATNRGGGLAGGEQAAQREGEVTREGEAVRRGEERADGGLPVGPTRMGLEEEYRCPAKYGV